MASRPPLTLCALRLSMTTRSPGHVGRGPGLVDEHQALRAQVRLPLTPSEPRGGNVRAILLGGMLRLFFRVSPAAARNRPIPDRLAAIPSAASRRRSSAIVRSGSAATRACTRSACAASVDRFQPPTRSACTVPRWCQRCISLTTKLMLTSNLAAVARRDAPPSTQRTTRSRKSTEYGRAIHRWPPRPSSQFESQQPHVVNPKSILPNRDPL